ncbi:hypothetical protein [Amycolatopsis sp. NPDC059021]|uniref:hypothetical protein n=1 Tax=Amycolatopsis sp. NPDC059021 TaxID=3346704 RepID=UPI00366BE69E
MYAVPVVLVCSPFAVVPVTVTGVVVVLAVGVSVPVQVVLSPAASVLALQVIAPLAVVLLTLPTVLVPVLVTGTATVAGWLTATGTALSGDPALVPLTVGVPTVRRHEHPVSLPVSTGAGAGAGAGSGTGTGVGTGAGPVPGHEHPVSAEVGVTGLVALAVLSPVPVPPADVAATGVGKDVAAGNVMAPLVAAVTGLDEPDCVVSAELTGARTRATGETGRVAEPLLADVVELVEPVPVVVIDAVGVEADAEVVLVDAVCCGCTSPDTSDVTVVCGLVPAVVTVAWSLVREGSVVSSAWATPTPRSMKPPANNPAWMDRFTQVCMRKPFQGLLG